MTILAWEKCDHVGPVFEEDILESRVQILERIPLAHGDLARLQLETFAVRGPEAPESTREGKVLDWELWAYLAAAKAE